MKYIINVALWKRFKELQECDVGPLYWGPSRDHKIKELLGQVQFKGNPIGQTCLTDCGNKYPSGKINLNLYLKAPGKMYAGRHTLRVKTKTIEIQRI